MSDVIYLTKEKIKELEEEVRDLTTRGRKLMAQQIADARSHGDLSENADYDAAKEAQSLMELRIAKMQITLSKARVIDPREFPDDKVYILTFVKVLNQKTNKEMTYQMVSPEEADFEQNKISITSPLGKSFMGKSKGEIATVNLPSGIQNFEILEISK